MKILSPNLIPHEIFHRCDWWKISGCDWWWWSKREDPNLRIGEIQHVDRELLSLIGFLWSNRIHTTPSCSGHFHINERKESIHSSILKSIRRDPSIARSEEGDLYDFSLEYPDDDWLNQIDTYQRKGVLGWKALDWHDEVQWPGNLISDNDIRILIVESSDVWNEVENIWRKNLR